MLIQIDYNTSFLAPEGRWQGTCIEVREFEKSGKKGNQKYLRIVFDLDLVEDGSRYRVGRDYPLNDKKGLQAVLKEWLGNSIGGKKFDVQTLVEKRATLEIVHIPPKHDHEEAFRLINRILPAEEPSAEPLEEAA